MPEKITYTVKDLSSDDSPYKVACKAYLYELINSGKLRARKCGGKTIVLRADLLAFLEGLPAING